MLSWMIRSRICSRSRREKISRRILIRFVSCTQEEDGVIYSALYATLESIADALWFGFQARERMSQLDWDRNYACLNNMFYVGTLDFREEARCTAAPILLVVFAAIIMGAMGIKCERPFSRCLDLLTNTNGVHSPRGAPARREIAP